MRRDILFSTIWYFEKIFMFLFCNEDSSIILRNFWECTEKDKWFPKQRLTGIKLNIFQEFFDLLQLYFPIVYDIKYLMKSCKTLKLGGLQVGTRHLISFNW